MAVETGLGGAVALRGIVPVAVDGRHVGVLEFTSGFDIPLERARATTGMGWSYSISAEVATRTERPPNPRQDAPQADDIHIAFSEPQIGEIVRAIRFNPRQAEHALVRQGGRSVFVKSFALNNFSGVPTITIANVQDVTDAFAGVLQSVLLKCALIFLAITILGSWGAVKFSQVRAAFNGVIGRQSKELAERIATGDAAAAKLRQVDLIKRGFFNNLVTAVSEPLQAVSGHLATLAPVLDRSPDPALAGRLDFPVAELRRLSRLVDDYHQIELFRQKLVPNAAPLADVVAQALEDDLALWRRLPQLSISAAVPADLPPMRIDAGMLRRAIGSLVGHAVNQSGQGAIAITGSQDPEKWLVLSLTGSAFAGRAAPTEALLDESRQFLGRLAEATGSPGPGRADGRPGAGPRRGRILRRHAFRGPRRGAGLRHPPASGGLSYVANLRPARPHHCRTRVVGLVGQPVYRPARLRLRPVGGAAGAHPAGWAVPRT
ncbi:MAG: hypothetical protein H7345_12530, partial [Rubritepida sp.]|nr:hypothetical protein [Rubritepida sp.]